ncbi:hypothetical protein IFR05_011114 [Cadophora sp. M221]|nr:hypothetical protein IFR05_011114 [Cadophora sp. M221]
MTDIPRYQYRPVVDGDGVRLLELEPSSDFEATIECSLIHTTLRECDEDLINHYTALSYVWGDAKVTKTIMVEGFGIDITINLDSALRYMRDPLRKRLIWADAICINQSDDDEKNRQVRQMGKVYRHATHTIIFLGEPTANTNFILKELQMQYPLTAKYGKMLEELPWSDILTRTWFQRVWVYQELIFSLDPWVQCGHLRLRWEVLYRNIESLKASNQHVEPWKAILQMGSGRERLASDVGRRGNASFSELLISTLEARRGQGVFDPRDMLFAHTGILGVPAVSPEIQDLTKVDYKKTCTEVYVDIVKHMLLSSKTQSYGIFSYAEAAIERTMAYRKLQIPSWAPNWMQKLPPYPYRRLRQAIELAQGRLGYNSKDVFHDEHPKPHHTWIGSSSTRLLVNGLIFGTLSKVSQVITSSRASLKFPPDGRTRRSWAKDDDNVGGKVYTARDTISNNWIDILLPVMTMRRSDIAMAIATSFGRQDLLPGKDGNDGFGHRSKRRQLFMLNRGSDKILRHLFLHAITDASDDKLYPHFLYGRKFAALEDGHLALVPGSAQLGDSICYFFGDSTVPFLLRPHPRPTDLKPSPDFRHFEFAGECIIDGLITSPPTKANLDKVLGTRKAQEKVFVMH